MRYELGTVLRVSERVYDNPYTESGDLKDNKFLGTFIVEQVLEEEMYSSIVLVRGQEDGALYLVVETEVTGFDGGSRNKVYPLDISEGCSCS